MLIGCLLHSTLFQIIFRLFSRRLNLNYNNLKSNTSTFTKNLNNTNTLKKNHSNVTPPPAYATLFHRNKVFTTNDYIKSQEMSAGKTQTINGRDYMVFQNEDGSTRLIPMRTPSATLFQYAYTK